MHTHTGVFMCVHSLLSQREAFGYGGGGGGVGGCWTDTALRGPITIVVFDITSLATGAHSR